MTQKNIHDVECRLIREQSFHRTKSVFLGEDKRKYKYAYRCSDLDEPVFIHSESILRKVIPDWVIYQELYETGPDDRKKMIMRNITAVEPEWLPVYVPFLCNLGNSFKPYINKLHKIF